MTTRLSESFKKEGLLKRGEEDKEDSYYIELSLAAKVGSLLDFDKIRKKYDLSNMKLNLSMESEDGTIVETEVLEVWEAHWEEWDRF